MSGDVRAPWWYSGDDDDPAVAESVPTDPEAHDAAVLEDVDTAEAEPDDAEPQGATDGVGLSSAMDWTALVAGAARMVDWATERVMAPHAEHGDPAEHPECMVCRTVTLIGDPVGLIGGGQGSTADGEPAAADEPGQGPDAGSGTQPIRWIPIVETSD